MNNENIRKEFEDYLNISHNKFWLILLGTNKNVRVLKEAEKSFKWNIKSFLDQLCAAVWTLTIWKVGPRTSAASLAIF